MALPGRYRKAYKVYKKGIVDGKLVRLQNYSYTLTAHTWKRYTPTPTREGKITYDAEKDMIQLRDGTDGIFRGTFKEVNKLITLNSCGENGAQVDHPTLLPKDVFYWEEWVYDKHEKHCHHPEENLWILNARTNLGDVKGSTTNLGCKNTHRIGKYIKGDDKHAGAPGARQKLGYNGGTEYIYLSEV